MEMNFFIENYELFTESATLKNATIMRTKIMMTSILVICFLLFHVRFPTVGAFVSSPPYTTTTFHTTSRLHSYSNLSPWSYNGSKGREKHWSSYVRKQLDNDDRGGESFTEEELAIFPSTTEDLTSLPQHASNDSINNIIDRAQKVMEKIQIDVQHDNKDDGNGDASKGSNGEAASGIDTVYSNSYVDLGKVRMLFLDDVLIILLRIIVVD